MRLVELASHYGVPIVEDDPYGELRYEGERLPTLKALDTSGCVIYLGTFSKILAPGLATGLDRGQPRGHGGAAARQAAVRPPHRHGSADGDLPGVPERLRG